MDTGSIEYRSHVQNIGWEKEWARDGGKSGTTGESKRVEAVEIQVLPQGSFPDGYDESAPAMVVG